MNHTPTPWRVAVTSDTRIGCSDGIGVADTAVSPRRKYEQAVNNANHIVRCVNAHDDLIAALEDAEFLMRKLAAHPDDCRAMLESFARSAQYSRAALAKAKGE